MNQLVPKSLQRLRRLAKRLNIPGIVEFYPTDSLTRYMLFQPSHGGRLELGLKASEARQSLHRISGESRGR